MSPRTGRPKSDNPRNYRFEIRMDKELAEKLQDCADRLQISKTAVIEKGIDLVHKSVK